jgi:hypothetical protein
MAVAFPGQRLRIFVTDSQSWETSSGFVGANGFLGGGGSGGARPQTAEIIKTFRERCPQLTVTMKQEKADYIVLLDHEGGKALFQKDNKVVVFSQEGDAIYSGSTVVLGNAVKDACAAIVSAENP